MVHGDVVDHFHHDDGFADAGAAEHAHFAAAGKRNQEIDNLNTCFQNVNGRVLFRKFGRFAMNRSKIFSVDRSETVHGAADNVQNSAETFFADGNGNRSTGVLGGHSSHQTVGDIHSDASDNIIAQMLCDFNNQVILLVVDCGVGNKKRVQNAGKLPFFKSHVNNRTNNLNNLSDIHNYLLANSRNLYFLRAKCRRKINLSPKLPYRLRYPSIPP